MLLIAISILWGIYQAKENEKLQNIISDRERELDKLTKLSANARASYESSEFYFDDAIITLGAILDELECQRMPSEEWIKQWVSEYKLIDAKQRSISQDYIRSCYLK